MVEKERRKGNAYVESPDTSRPSWWSRSRQPLLISVSVLVFVLLLSEHPLATVSMLLAEHGLRCHNRGTAEVVPARGGGFHPAMNPHPTWMRRQCACFLCRRAHVVTAQLISLMTGWRSVADDANAVLHCC